MLQLLRYYVYYETVFVTCGDDVIMFVSELHPRVSGVPQGGAHRRVRAGTARVPAAAHAQVARCGRRGGRRGQRRDWPARRRRGAWLQRQHVRRRLVVLAAPPPPAPRTAGAGGTTTHRALA